MKTKLETMVGYLAGRQGDAVERIRLELADPGSEASQWLAEVRSRSRALFNPGSLNQPPGGRSPAISRFTAEPRPSRRRWLPQFVLGVSATAVVIFAVGAFLKTRDDRIHRLESLLAQQDARWGERIERLKSAVTLPRLPLQEDTPTVKKPTSHDDKPALAADPTTALALARLEAKLGELGERLGREEPKAETPDLSGEPLRGDLERLRREMMLGSQANKRQIQELSAVLREMMQLLKELAVNARTAVPIQIPVPIPMHQGHDPAMGQRPDANGSGQLLLQGQMQRQPQWGSQKPSGGHFGPGMQTPGGPG
jgi:hypothetical protein